LEKTEGGKMRTIIKNSALRKQFPVTSGGLYYFPQSMYVLSHVSYLGNQKHSPGAADLVWVRDLSADHKDCITRHLIDASFLTGKDKVMELAAAVWRAHAYCETEIEKQGGLGAIFEPEESK
jgi:hypothetical protein